jgi:hypothetical protein
MTKDPGMAEPADIERTEHSDAEVDRIVSRGPAGTFAVAGIATAIVVALYFAFYLFVYLPRGTVQ